MIKQEYQATKKAFLYAAIYMAIVFAIAFTESIGIEWVGWFMMGWFTGGLIHETAFGKQS